MKEFQIVFQKGLSTGLRSSDRNSRNAQALVEAQGMFPESGTLRSLEELDLISGVTALGETFPFPQVWEGQAHILVMGSTKIWEVDGATLSLKIEGLVAGGLWTVADFFDYMLLTNGQQIVKRDAVTHAWSVLVDDNVPISNCIQAVNDQLIVGSPRRLL